MNKLFSSTIIYLLIGLLSPIGLLQAAEPIQYEKQIKPIFTKYCFDCHSGKEPEGDMLIYSLDPDFLQGEDNQMWHAMLDAVNRGEMPPEDEEQLNDTERRLLVTWLTSGLKKATEQGRGKIEPVVRRLNRHQYNRTLRDLLHLNLDLGQDLPDDALSYEGFKNNGEALNMSSLHIEYYMKAARAALDKTIVTKKLPEIHHFRVELGKNINPDINPKKQRVQLGYQGALLKPEDYKYSEPAIKKSFPYDLYKRRTKYTFNEGYQGNGTIKALKDFDDIFHSVFVDFRGAKGRYTLREDGVDLKPITKPGKGNMKVVIREYPLEGNFVIRVKASRIGNEKDIPKLAAYIGVRRDDGEGYTEVGPSVPIESNQPQVYEFMGRFEEMTLPSYEADNDHYLGNLMHVGVYNDPSIKGAKSEIKIHSIDFEAPYYTSWPPQGHASIFIDSANKENLEKYAKEIFANFLTRAYRRPPTEKELNLMMSFWQELKQEHQVFEQSIKETLVIALSSPQFLYIHEPANKSRPLTDYELTARLSYFLWDTMPDEKLFELAAKGTLKANLDQQVTRMVKDPRSERFVAQFADQWLDVSRMDRTVVYKRGEYTDQLKADMKAETFHFVKEILSKNQSVMDFVDSDFVMINENLAKLYRINDVKGPEFRRVNISAKDHRGGVLTHASIMTGHSSGRDSNPVKRGVWLSKKILGNPPPPPPPGVPPLDEENPELVKLPIQKQLEIHRNNPACKDCHNKIDPWGIAFENYDTIGMYRDDKKNHSPATTLPGGHKIEDLNDLKKYLLTDKRHDIAKAFAKTLSVYALGRSLSYADDPTIEKIVSETKKNNHLMQEMIQALVKSEMFQTR